MKSQVQILLRPPKEGLASRGLFSFPPASRLRSNRSLRVAHSVDSFKISSVPSVRSVVSPKLDHPANRQLCGGERLGIHH